MAHIGMKNQLRYRCQQFINIMTYDQGRKHA